MIHDERHFEMLAALAVACQLSEAEFLELEQHAAQCSPCTQRITEMEAASRRLFLLNAPTTKVSRIPVGMQQRFLLRAIDAGVPLNRPPVAHSYPNVFRLAPVAVALVLILSVGWNAVFERPWTVTRDFVSAPTASAPAPSLPVTSPADRRAANNLLPIHRPSKKQNLRKRPAQMKTQLLTYVPSDGGRADEKGFFSLNPASFLKAATTVTAVGGIPTDFHAFGADNFIPDYNRARKLQVSSFSAPTPWSVKKQEKPNKRVFYYRATLASLSFLDYQSDFRPKESVPDPSNQNAFNPIRFRQRSGLVSQEERSK